MTKKAEDVDSRIERLLGQLEATSSQAEVELIESKIEILKSMKQ